MRMHQRNRLRRSIVPAVVIPALLAPFALGVSPAQAATISTLADFEQVPAGFFSYGSAGFGLVDVPAGERPELEAPSKVLSYGFDVTGAGSFGGVGHNFTGSAEDWSAFDGIRFWLQGEGSGDALQFEVFDGGANADASERWDTTITDTSSGWREIVLPWSAFTRATDFQPGGAPTDGELELTSVWGYALPAVSGAATVRVDDIALYSEDDIAPTVSIVDATVDVLEGRTATVELRLNVAAAADVTVGWSTAGGTAASGDFTGASGTATFTAGATTAEVEVATTDDEEQEPSETFTVTLADAAGAELGSPATATVTILDDDTVTGPPAGRTQLVEDFEQPLPQQAPPAPPAPQLGWLVAQDPASTVSFTTTDAPPAPVPGAGDGNTVLSADYDIASWGVVVDNFTDAGTTEWLPQDWSTFEGLGFWMHGTGSGTGLFLDLLDNRTPGSQTDDAERFSYAFADNWEGWRFLQIPFSELTRKEIGNGAPNDGLTLTEVHGLAFGALRTDAPTTYFVDDVLVWGEAEPPALAVGFDRASYQVSEGEDAVLTVRLNRVADQAVSVRYEAADEPDRTATEDLPATIDRDFEIVSGTVTIPAGSREATIAVPTLENAKPEVDETFVVDLSGAEGAELGFNDRGLVSIQDDDPVDPALIEDFERGAGLWDSDAELAVREIPAGAPGAYPGQDVYEHVLDVSSEAGDTLVREFAQPQDWSGYEGLSFWYEGEGDGETVTVGLSTGGEADPGLEGWELAWSDEFEGPAGAPADPENWTYETGGWGWGNDELQYYTDSTDNAALDGDGNLVITAREVDPATSGLECWYGPCTHTSARLVTENKQEFQYGRIETRVLVPRGSGIWPAVWTLGNDFRDVGWPQTGEIDIMEFVGKFPDEVFGTIHGPGYSGGASYGGTHTLDEPVYEDWHTFSVEWQPGGIAWFVDGIQYHSAAPEDVPGDWVYDHPFTLLTNVAVGGNFGGPLGEDLVFPQSLAVDYIRVYQAPDTAQRFEAEFVDDTNGWRKVTLPFDAFDPAGTSTAVLSASPAAATGLDRVSELGFSWQGSGEVGLDRILLEPDVALPGPGGPDGPGGPGAGPGPGGGLAGTGPEGVVGTAVAALAALIAGLGLAMMRRRAARR